MNQELLSYILPEVKIPYKSRIPMRHNTDKVDYTQVVYRLKLTLDCAIVRPNFHVINI